MKIRYDRVWNLLGSYPIHTSTGLILIVTLGKSETYKETMKEKSTILPYSIHKRIHVRPLRNLIQGIHVNVNTIQSTVLKEAAIRNRPYTRTSSRYFTAPKGQRDVYSSR